MNAKIKYTLLDLKSIDELKTENITDEIIGIIHRIYSSYPFTFLEKESLRSLVDKLNNFFWIKSRKGICELVNNKLADSLESISQQLEGNPEETFFPPEYQRVIKSANDLVQETKKIVKLEGINFIDRIPKIYFDLFYIPLVNEENTVIAVISFALDSEGEKKHERKENYSYETLSLEYLPVAAALISRAGLVIKVNRKFESISARSEQELVNSSINKVFSSNFQSIFSNFIDSSELELVVEATELSINPDLAVVLRLGKIFDERNNVNAFLLIINEVIENSANSLQRSNLGMIENLIRYNPDAVLICDKENLKFLEVNDNALNLYGYRKEEFMQMDLTDLFLAEDIQLLLDSSSASLKEGFFYGPYKHKRKDGKVIFIEMSKFSVKYQDHEAHFNVVREVSNKLEADKRNQSFKSVFENTDDLVFITDASGFILFINEQVQNKLGYAKNELVDSSFASLAIDADRSRVNLSIFHANKKVVTTLSINLKSLMGQLLHVDLAAVPVLDHENEITGFTIIAKLKESLPASASFDSVTTLTSAKGKMEENAAVNSKFLAELFHDLLTPINVILGYAQGFSAKTEIPTEEQREAVNVIKQNRANLLQSMNAAIEFASLTESSSSLDLSEIKITDIIDLLVKDIEEFKSANSAELAYGKISSSLKFETDQTKFRNFLFLLFKITSTISDQKKIYFSAYARDKESFIVTYRDLQTYSSKALITSLQNLFENKDASFIEKPGVSGIIINLAKLLFETLQGKFVILSEEKDKPDYGMTFPFVYTSVRDTKAKRSKSQHEIESKDSAVVSKGKTEPDKVITLQAQQPDSDKKLPAEVKRSEKLDANLRNELRIEMLREKIRSKEAELRTSKSEENVEENFEDEEQELVEDTIEYFDLDLQGSPDEPIEEEIIEITETTAPKVEKADIVHHPLTDEKVDISKLSCLYFEDQIDSQVLFRVQMKGLRNLDFAVSFEESLPLLDSGNYDFIVIDINLQGSYNGLDILRILRSMPKYESIPVFAVTAYVLPGDQQKFVLAGFNGFISKPIFRDQMIDLLAEVFNEPKHS